MNKSLDERSDDDDEEFHSSTESLSSHGDLGPPALLAVHFVLACAAVLKRHHGPGPPPYPLGLPHFPAKKKGRKSPLLHKETISKGNLQHDYGAPKAESSSNGFSRLLQTKNIEGFLERSQSCPLEASFGRTQEYPWNAPTMEKFVIKSSTPTHVESFPLVRRSIRAASMKERSSGAFTQQNEDDGLFNSPVRVSMDKHLDRGSLNELQSKRKNVKRELDLAADGECSNCTLDLCKDGEASSCVSSQTTLGSDEEGSINGGVRRITDTDFSSIRELPEDYIEASTISWDKLSKSSRMAHGEKRHSPFLDHEADDYENRQSAKHKKVGEKLERHHTNIRSGDGSDLKDRRLHKGTDLEGSSADRRPEEGHLNSLLLWPVGLAVEVISFQVRLVAQAFALIIVVYNWCDSFTSNRVHETLQAKERATEALSQKISVITNVPPKVTESGSMVLKRAAWGCLAATYVCILLSMLLFPALFLDYVFLSKIVEEPVNVKEPLHFDYTLAHPAAIVSVHPSERMRNSMGKFGSQQENARAIPIAHKVHITVILTLPESDYNRNLGMFQLSAELLSGTGESIKLSSRPCMLRFHSTPIRMLRTFLASLPLLLGGFAESQTLVVHLMEFEEQQIATSAVRILLQPKAGMPLGQGIPEIYSADVHVESHLPWLKNMMRNWKWTAYIWMGLMLYVMEIIMVLCCCRHALLPQRWIRLNEDEDKAEQPGRNTPAEVRESSSSKNRVPRKRRPNSLDERIPTARAILDRRESKLRQNGSHPSL